MQEERRVRLIDQLDDIIIVIVDYLHRGAVNKEGVWDLEKTNDIELMKCLGSLADTRAELRYSKVSFKEE